MCNLYLIHNKMASILEHLVHRIRISDKIYLHLAYKAKYFLIKHVCKTYRDFFKENTNKFHSVLVDRLMSK